VRQLTPVGTDQTETALAAGITDELIVRLRQIPELRIATAEADGSVPSDAFEGAYFVDGTIRSSGDQLRVTARLHDGDGEILWSQVFDRGLIDLFDVQEEIASSIAGALSVSFDVGGNSAAYGGTDNPEAYAAYMQYQAHLLDPDFDSRPYLERAVELDPKYAKARAALNGDYGLQVSQAPEGAKLAVLGKMDRDTRAALAANPNLWNPHAGRGMYHAYRHDFVAADREFQQVANLDKGNDPELRSFLANYQMLVGRVRKATSTRQSNELIDPIERDDPFRVYDLEMRGRFQDSINLFRRFERKGQAGVTGFVPHVFVELLLSGREADAMKFVEQHRQPRYGEMLTALRENPALPTMSEPELRSWARERYASRPEFDLARSALMAGHLGQPKLAVGLMKLAFEGPSAGALWSLWHPAMAEARRTDEFEQLVSDLGFVKAWRASGDWGDYCRPVSATEITCT
jgi:TolB-like protein